MREPFRLCGRFLSASEELFIFKTPALLFETEQKPCKILHQHHDDRREQDNGGKLAERHGVYVRHAEHPHGLPDRNLRQVIEKIKKQGVRADIG